MIFFHNKKRREKPRYKKLLIARENVLNKKKITELKKKKWSAFQFHYNNKLKFFNYYKAFDQKKYTVTRDAKKGLAYKKRYRDTLNAIRGFKIAYGSFKKHYFKNLIKFALKNHKKQKIAHNLNIFFISKIESRLDVVLLRSKFCWSINLARQIIKHGKVKVNQKIVKSKGYYLKPGDFITIDRSMFFKLDAMNNQIALKKNAWPHTPRHLHLNYKTMQIIFNNPNNENFTNTFTFNLKLEKILLNYLKTQ